jgi:hypothetical protein
MSKVLCVLYDDPVDGYPEDRALPRRPELQNRGWKRRGAGRRALE